MIRLAAAACAAWASWALPAAAGTLKTFDLPGQSAICGAGIADDGTVVGNSVATRPEMNFTYQNGAFSVLQAGFDSGLTSVTGINRAHTLVGTNTRFTRNFTVEIKGFALHGADRRMLRLPGAVEVAATGINNDGTIVGYYMASMTGPSLGYVKHGDTVTTLNDGSGAVVPSGIDPSGTRVVGTSLPLGGTITAWIWQGGQFTTLSPPGTLATFAYGINRAGTVSGSYETGSQSAPVWHGYIYKDGKFVTYDVPGASRTQFTGINVRGAVTGCYTDGTGTHGLIYGP
jgi:hypothetical protein